MQRIPVESSNIKSVGYDDTLQILEIEFNNGSIYQYFEIHKNEFDGIISAKSKGQYFHTRIRDKYATKKIQASTKDRLKDFTNRINEV